MTSATSPAGRRRSRPRLARGLLVGVVVASVAVPSALAFVCHPDRPGTRRLTVHGQLLSYSMHGRIVRLSVVRDGACTRLSWNVFAPRARRSGACTDGSRATGARASSGGYTAVAVPDGAVTVYRHGLTVRTISAPGPVRGLAFDRQRLVVLAGSVREDTLGRLVAVDVETGRVVRNWPMPYDATSVDADGGVAVLSGPGRTGVYGIRLRDGKIALLGIKRLGEPQIEKPGIAYSDGLYRGRLGTAVMKFVPRRAVQSDLVRAARPLRTETPIRAFSMDGPRVAVAVARAGGTCDRIRYWNVPWHYAEYITDDDSGPTCPGGEHARAAPVASIALGGITSEWVLRSRRPTVVWATSVACVERVLAAGEIRALAADGSLVAYAAQRSNGWEVGALGSGRRSRVLATGSGRVRALSADGHRVAILGSEGSVVLVPQSGGDVHRLAVGQARAIALRGSTLAVLDGARLEVFDTETDRLEHSRRVPSGVRSELDVHDGVAVLSRRRNVYAVQLETGRTVLLARAPAAVHAQIEAPGVAYRYNLAGHGHARFVPVGEIERRLR